jgi:ketosteroid isomerase-like protein
MATQTPTFELILNTANHAELSTVAESNRRAIEAAYQSMLAGNDSALFDLSADDVTFFEAPSLPYGCVNKGREGARSGVAGMLGAWSTLHVEIEAIAASSDLVVVYLSMRAKSRATGETYEGPAAEIFRFANGKIIEWRPIYWDTHRVREVCGLE